MGIAHAASPSLNFLKVSAPDKPSLHRLLQMDLDIPEQRLGPEITVIGTDADKAWLEVQGYTVTYQLRNAERFYAERAQAAGAVTMGGFRALAETWAAVDSIIALYPSVASAKFNIGSSHEGRPIYAIRISDNPNTDEAEPAILFTGLHHAREPIGPHILLYTMQQLASGYGVDSEITGLVDSREIWFVPIVNPDGYEYNRATNPAGGGMWRKNRRNNGDGTFGVDPNRNYGYFWGHDNSGSSPNTNSETYRGPFAFSEPEIQVIRDFCFTHPNIVIAMNYHSYSDLLLYPWGYDQIYTPDNDIFASMADSATSFNGYAPGPGWGLYLTNGDSDDWMYGDQGILSFTPEVGGGSDGFWPSPSRILPLTLENHPANMLMIKLVERPGRLLSPIPSVWDSISVVGSDSLGLFWHNDDTMNAPVLYDVVELFGGQTITDGLEANANNWALNGFTRSASLAYSSFYSLHSGILDATITYARMAEGYQVQPGDALMCRMNYVIENGWDYAYVQISADGINYASIPGSITTNNNPNGRNLGNGITGTTNGAWVLASFPLTAYEGQEVFIRFAYSTDIAIHEAGLWVDNITPVQTYDSVNAIASTATNSFVLTGLSPGDYAFRILATDPEGQSAASLSEYFSYIPPYVAGDVNASGEITSGDIIYLVIYVFRGGAAPVPVEAAGDVNASGSVTSSDIVYLVNYVFKAGPPPIQP
jgi:hypothetical protein